MDAPGLSELAFRWQEEQRQGRTVSPQELCAGRPELLADLERLIQALESMQAFVNSSAPGVEPPAQPSEGAAPLPAVPGYEVRRVLGRGGMGVVYEARHLRLNRVVALKMILAGTHASADELARFRTEAEAVARLRHPGVVQIYEAGDREGLPYLALEYCEGGSLADRLDGTPLRPAQAAALVEQITQAVAVAHQQQVIHRDLKPGNVLLDRGGLPKVSDFGVAKVLGEAGRTASGAVVGTPSYMAPEQADGKARSVGPAADIYALGAILYECLTGRPPFKGPTPLDTVLHVLRDEPVPLRQLQPTVPRDLETICLKCLQKDPNKRYATAEALAADCSAFLNGAPIAARPAGRIERGWRWSRRNPRAAFLVLLLTLSPAFVLLGKNAWDQNARQARADALFHSLFTADGSQLGAAVRLAQEHLPLKQNEFRQVWRDEQDSPDRRLRAALVVAPGDADAVAYLSGRLPDASPWEVPLICDALVGQWEVLSPQWLRLLSDSEEEDGRRLRAACALVRLAPAEGVWKERAATLADLLASHSTVGAEGWLELLAPARDFLVSPLRRIYESRSESPLRRTVASGILARFLSADPAALIDLLRTAGPEQFPALFARLTPAAARSRWLLQERLTALSSSADPTVRPDEHARQLATLAVALFRLGEPKAVRAYLASKPDPRLRYYVIHSLGPLGADATRLLNLMDTTADPPVLAGLLLALGEFAPENLAPAAREGIERLLQELYQHHPDCGVHSAAEWLWKKEFARSRLPSPQRSLRDAISQGAKWYTTSQGQTFSLILAPDEFLMGSPRTETGHATETVGPVGNETQAVMAIQPFAIATTEVTLEQHRLIFPQQDSSKAAGDLPVNMIEFADIALYCNSLSEREGLPASEWCFDVETNGKSRMVFVAPDFAQRAGYRLPTEAEWEYACRAGTTTSRFFGDSAEFMPKYGQSLLHSGGRVWPVGSLRPNPLGLFDVYGNVAEWCLPSRADVRDRYLIQKGGHYQEEPAEPVRSARRVVAINQFKDNRVGFRLARTLKQDSVWPR